MTSRPTSSPSWRRRLAPRPEAGAFRAIVSGSVQGVGFRYSACRYAQRLGLRGWVRNLDSGEVEVWAEGEGPALAEFREWLEEGPPGAVVGSVRAEAAKPTERYADFSIEA